MVNKRNKIIHLRISIFVVSVSGKQNTFFRHNIFPPEYVSFDFMTLSQMNCYEDLFIYEFNGITPTHNIYIYIYIYNVLVAKRLLWSNEKCFLNQMHLIDIYIYIYTHIYIYLYIYVCVCVCVCFPWGGFTRLMCCH